MSNNGKPASKVTLYPVSAAIWRNEGVKGGEPQYNATFERSYKDTGGNWKSSDTFNVGDLLLLAKVVDRAHSEIYKLRESDRKAQQSEE